MSDTPEEREAQAFFETLQLRVTRIPASGTRTADFVVDGDGRGYVIEVKTREESKADTKRLRTGEVVDVKRPIRRDRNLRDNLRDARAQFSSTDPTHARFWGLYIVPLLTFGRDSQLDLVVGTLYGSLDVVMVGPDGGAISKQCFYAVPGLFEQLPDLDFALISGDEGLLCCANEFSPLEAELRETAMARELGRAFFRPSEREAQSKAVIADVNWNRRDRNELQSRLREKYRDQFLQVVDFKLYAVSAAIDTLLS